MPRGLRWPQSQLTMRVVEGNGSVDSAVRDINATIRLLNGRALSDMKARHSS